MKNRKTKSKKNPRKQIRRQKNKICKSSETRVVEVSRRSERSSRGTRTSSSNERPRQRRTSNVRLPLELPPDRAQTSATCIWDNLEKMIFSKKMTKNIFGYFRTKNVSKKHNFQRQKIESCKSSKTRVAEVSRRSERCSRGKQTSEVRRRRTVR